MEKQLAIEAKRFKEIREQKQFTQQAFAELLGVKSSAADIERGKTKISGEVVIALIEHFKINPLWLFGKSNRQYIDLEHTDVSPRVIAIDAQGNDSILMVNQKAAAGYPHNIQDVDWVGALPAFHLPLPEYRNATYRGFQVEGDSMMPTIRPKEWVLGKAVSSISEASDRKIFIVVLNDSVLVKKLQKIPNNVNKVRLISLNPEYLPIEVDVSTIQELWQVNSKLTFGIEEPSESTLLRQLQQSMNELKGQINKLNS